MKGSAFGERARMLAEWFQDWNSCEQTIALYSLLSKVSATQARFLSLVLEHSLKNGCDSAELSRLEKQANNSGFLSSLHSQNEEQALSQLLAHLPLLNPGNVEARREYMKLLPKVMLGSSEELDYLDQCRQLLSLALVHPAFPHEDREALTYWLSQLDRKQKNISDRSPQRPPPIPPRIHQIKSSEEYGGRSSGGNGRIYINGDLSRADSLGGGEGEVDALGYEQDEDDIPGKSMSLQHGQSLFGTQHDSAMPLTSLDDIGVMSRSSKTLPVPRTVSLSSLPGSNVASGTAEEQQVDWKAGMKDVPVWLKSLRLHKYQHLFAELGYEEMLTMQEAYLEQKNVTKGARTKIILSIRKLARRPETLQEIEQDIEKHGRLVQCINELRQMLLTPIKPYSPVPPGAPTASHDKETNEGDGEGEGGETKSPPEGKAREKVRQEAGAGDDDDEDRPGSPSSPPNAQHSSSDGGSDLEELLAKDFPHEDLPSLLTRAMGKAYHQLMLHTDTNEENLSGFLKLLDTALQHEVFTVEQKNLFFDWKQQCNQTLRVLSPKKPPKGRHWGPGFYTIHAMPSATANSRLSGAAAHKTRSLRSPRSSTVNNKIVSLPNFGRSSSTLPRMSARQLQQQPLPHHAPSFLRPKSNIFPAGATPTVPSGPPMSPQAKPFLPPSQPSAFGAPPPLPPRHYEVNDSEMDYFCERVTAHVIDDSSDN